MNISNQISHRPPRQPHPVMTLNSSHTLPRLLHPHPPLPRIRSFTYRLSFTMFKCNWNGKGPGWLGRPNSDIPRDNTEMTLESPRAQEARFEAVSGR